MSTLPVAVSAKNTSGLMTGRWASIEVLDIQPVWSDKIVQTIAINTHLSWRNTVWGTPGWKPLYKELGVRTTRANLGNSNPGLADLQEIGSKAVSQIQGFDKVLGQAWVDFAKAHPEVMALEGTNEPNNGDTAGWDTQTRDWQNWLYGVRGSLPVVGPSIWGREANDARLLGPVPCDYGNLHYYTAGLRPTVTIAGPDSGASGTLDQAIADIAINAPSKPVWITESGFGVAGPNLPLSAFFITPLAQAKYILRLLCECFNRGVGLTAIYSFIDDVRTPPRYHGLITQQFERRPAFDALKRFIALFSDAGAVYAPAPVSATITVPAGVLSLPVMRKRDGTLLFAFWQDVESYDRTSFVDLTAAPLNVTIDLGAQHDFEIYRPTLNSTASLAQGESVSVPVRDDLVVVRAI